MIYEPLSRLQIPNETSAEQRREALRHIAKAAAMLLNSTEHKQHEKQPRIALNVTNTHIIVDRIGVSSSTNKAGQGSDVPYMTRNVQNRPASLPCANIRRYANPTKLPRHIYIQGNSLRGMTLIIVHLRFFKGVCTVCDEPLHRLQLAIPTRGEQWGPILTTPQPHNTSSANMGYNHWHDNVMGE